MESITELKAIITKQSEQIRQLEDDLKILRSIVRAFDRDIERIGAKLESITGEKYAGIIRKLN